MIKLEHIKKNFTLKDKRVVEVLKDINVTFPSSSMSFIVGYSGSGKTTLLDIIGCLLTPDSGEVYIDDKKIDYSSSKSLNEIRSKLISFVFQDFNLLEDFTIEDNLVIAGLTDLNKVDELLKKVGLYEKKGTEVKYLSGGEKQRLAIARALGRNTDVILLDEPTGSLDKKNTKQVMELLKEISKEKTIVVVTHEEHLVEEYGDFACEIDDGVAKVILEKRTKKPENPCDTYSNPPKFSFKKQLAYSLRLIKMHPIRNLAACLLLLVSLALVFADFILLNLDSSPAIYTLMQNVNISQVPISGTQTDFFLPDLTKASYSGEAMNEALDSKHLTHYNFINGRIGKNADSSNLSDFYSENINFNIVVSDTFEFNGTTYNAPGEDEVYITSFLNEFLGDMDQIRVYLPYNNSDNEFEVFNFNVKSDFLPVSYTKQFLTDYKDGKLELTDSDLMRLNSSYLEAYISYDTYLKCFEKFEVYQKGYAPSNEYSNPVSYEISYKKSEDETYLFGRKPSSENEIAISKNYASYLFPTESLNNLVGVDDLYFKDFEEFPNYSSSAPYIDLIPLYKMPYQTYKISGIVDDNKADIYVSDKFIDEYLALSVNCLSGINVVISSSEDFSSLLEFGLRVNYSTFSSLLSFYESSPTIIFAKQGITTLGALFIVLFVSITYFTCTISVNDKVKEIAIMKSLGIKKKDTYGPFIWQNLIVSLVSLVFCFALVAICLAIANSVLMSKIEVAAIYNISLLRMDVLSAVLTVLIGLFIPFLVSLMPIFKIKKVDISLELKSK